MLVNPCSLQTAGMGETAAFNLNLGLNSMYIVGTLTSWACEWWSVRRTLLILLTQNSLVPIRTS